MAGRSKIEAALYESFVRGELNRPVTPKPGRMGMTSSAQVRASADDGGAGQLVKALSGFSDELNKMFTGMETRENHRQMQKAEKEYMGMTMEQRRVLMESGQLQGQDPLYGAVFSRLWGEDVARRSREEINAKIASGELKFDTPEALDKFLEERRKYDLQNYNGNEYALSGYDHQFNIGRSEASRLNSQLRAKERRESDLMSIQSKLLGDLKDGATPGQLKRSYDILQQSGNFTDIEMHQRLAEVAQTLSREGKYKELEALLGQRFSEKEEFGTLGQFLGDNSVALIKNGQAENLRQRREAFEKTYTDLRQAAHNGQLARMIGAKAADPKTLYGWLEKNGGQDLLEPTQIDSLLQMNANTIERKRAEAERNLMRQQMAQMRARLQQNAINQALMFGRAGVKDQTIVDANGVTQVISADSLYRQAALHTNQRIDRDVATGKITPQQGFVEKLNFYGKGGTNPEWEDKLKFGVGAFGLLAANPNDKNAKRVATEAIDLYARLKASGVAGIETRHVDAQSRKLLEAGITAQRMNLNPLDVVTRFMNNPDASVRVTTKELLKAGIKEDRLKDAAAFAQVLVVGAGMPEKDAVREAKKYVTDYALNINGTTVFPITRQMSLDDQQGAAERLIKAAAERFKAKGIKPEDLVLEAPNAAAGFYSVRIKGAFAPLRDDEGRPVVITKDDLLRENAAEAERKLIQGSKKAVSPTPAGQRRTRYHNININMSDIVAP